MYSEFEVVFNCKAYIKDVLFKHT